MRIAEEIREYLADLSRRVECVFVDLDGGRWLVSELDFIGERIWVRARPESSRQPSVSEMPTRVFHSDVHPGTRLEFMLDDGATVQLFRSSSDGDLRLKLKGRNGSEAPVEEASELFGQGRLGA